jgi:cysteine dioxygenase
MDSLVDRCRALADADEPTLESLMEALREGDPAAALALARADSRHPYGRRVFLETDRVEGMIAAWTRSFPCAPHDHGGSVGAVRVLAGEVVHRMWSVVDGKLRLAAEERRGTGDILLCGAHLVHSMMDGGAEEPLVTLHLYTNPIDHMVVYDTAVEQTFVVQGQCGAWIPRDAPELVRSVVDGIVDVADAVES